MKGFQTILLIFFGILVVVAVLIFSGIIPIGRNNEEQLAQNPITMWGTLTNEEFKMVNDAAKTAGDFFDITYTKKSRETIESELIDALASGVGPDLLLAPHTLILKQKDKFLPLPYTFLPERLYRDSFLESTEILLEADNILAVPAYLDPLVMYWNRDLFSNAGLANPPLTWTEVQVLPTKLTKLDDKGNIKESAVALGGTSNIAHFKEILISQILQTGNKIVSISREISADGLPEIRRDVVLASDDGAESALRFYVQFSDPALKKYSWNRALDNSFEEFTAGRLALYFGLASELNAIKTRNPHLNFDVALVPGIRDGGKRTAYSNVYALAILKNSKVSKVASSVAYKMAFGESAKAFAKVQGLPPARRDLISKVPADPLIPIFYDSAVVAGTWYDPNSEQTRMIFADMVEAVSIGRSDMHSAVTDAETRISELFRGR